jgi:hypothetical protein
MPGEIICQPGNLIKGNSDGAVIQGRQPLAGAGDPYLRYSQETALARLARPVGLKLCRFTFILTIT